MHTFNLSSLCRTCLHKETLKPIFKNVLDATNYSDIVFIATGVKIEIDDGLSQCICNKCLNKLNNTLEFRKQCKEAEKQLLILKDEIKNVKCHLNVEIEAFKTEGIIGNTNNKVLDKEILNIKDTTVKSELNKSIDEDDDDKPLKYLISNINDIENLYNDKIVNDLTKDNVVTTNIDVKKYDHETNRAECKVNDKTVLTNHNHAKEESTLDLCKDLVEHDCITRHHGIICDENNDRTSNNLPTKVFKSYCKDKEIKIGTMKEKIEATEDVLYEFDVTDPEHKRVNCRLCQKNLSIRSIDVHVAKTHPGADKTRVKCELCDNYVMKHKLNRHKILTHGSQRLKCKYCKGEFDDKGSLIDHVGNCGVKKKRRVCQSSRELRECDVCHKIMQKASLRVHKAIKHAGLRPVCEHCGRNFGNKFRLLEHYRAKHGYEKIKCSVCDFQSAGVMAMRNHERRHRGEKPYECDVCGAKFHAAYLLAQHKQSHATEKHFQCDRCPASFKANNSLHMHKRSCHSNAKYACAVCARAYSCRNYAVKHMRSVHRYSGPVPPLMITQ